MDQYQNKIKGINTQPYGSSDQQLQINSKNQDLRSPIKAKSHATLGNKSPSKDPLSMAHNPLASQKQQQHKGGFVRGSNEVSNHSKQSSLGEQLPPTHPNTKSIITANTKEVDVEYIHNGKIGAYKDKNAPIIFVGDQKMQPNHQHKYTAGSLGGNQSPKRMYQKHKPNNNSTDNNQRLYQYDASPRYTQNTILVNRQPSTSDSSTDIDIQASSRAKKLVAEAFYQVREPSPEYNSGINSIFNKKRKKRPKKTNKKEESNDPNIITSPSPESPQLSPIRKTANEPAIIVSKFDAFENIEEIENKKTETPSFPQRRNGIYLNLPPLASGRIQNPKSLFEAAKEAAPKEAEFTFEKQQSHKRNSSTGYFKNQNDPQTENEFFQEEDSISEKQLYQLQNKLIMEYEELMGQKDKLIEKGIYVIINDESFLQWNCILFINGGYYEKAQFKADITFPINFPEERMRVHFNHKIYHPMINYETCELDLSKFRKKDPLVLNLLYFMKDIFNESKYLENRTSFNIDAGSRFNTNQHYFKLKAKDSVKLSKDNNHLCQKTLEKDDEVRKCCEDLVKSKNDEKDKISLLIDSVKELILSQ